MRTEILKKKNWQRAFAAVVVVVATAVAVAAGVVVAAAVAAGVVVAAAVAATKTRELKLLQIGAKVLNFLM